MNAYPGTGALKDAERSISAGTPRSCPATTAKEL
jgi:hypothetical protein